mmetsp:Transcript_34116/g.45098  ORF Transcript_34116/g.45098 Transcript_34116/m.45098 type:complete len:357 (-) Transcript_34116:264-1334(-)|eukprot:CAMPEP_0117757864 /NCGR_PEP_ID=MMETSP0947-20121206/15010_1 /TAXON_ID=44440 /ORGANISM="Chattonella subsalsa, Strain CCMP2191" /LENGTH=356 /DNA_ID=CAMNT_0005577889 /DNA_START=111 /DNA_END=1181 /DNA_ORIENTATION=-
MDNPNSGLAFALVTGAGLSTALGAAMVFSERLVKLANKRFLAGALSISSGVMLYVSFVEIFGKSTSGFEDAGYSEEDSYLYATLAFFGGILIGKFLDFLVHRLDSSHSHDLPEETSSLQGGVTPDCETASSIVSEEEFGQAEKDQKVHKGKNDEETKEDPHTSPDLNTIDLDKAGKTMVSGSKPMALETESSTSSFEITADDSEKKLVRMGIMTALAIGIHNFPEGLATFVATLDDPAVGASLAVAIAIHNIPEGLCVSIPIYYATGSRTKAFVWALLSGVSEPIGAGLGWLVLSSVFSDALYGVLFGLVSGMMVNICLHELIPTAHRHDPKDTVVTNGIILGMVIMSLSLILFIY